MKMKNILNEIALNDEIYYHGTNKAFDKFKYSSSAGLGGEMLGKGIYVTNNPEYAVDFGKIILKCKINVSNPLDLRKAKEGLFDDFLPYITNQDDKENLDYLLRSRSLVTGYRIIRKYVDIKLMQKIGYDCVVSHADFPGSSSAIEIAVFNPNKVKIIGQLT